MWMCIIVYVHVYMCVCPMGSRLALSCFCLSSSRVVRVSMCIIRETPQGIVDSINPTHRRAFLIPRHTHTPQTHTLISRLRQYEWHIVTWMQASAFLRRCNGSDLIIFLSDMSVPSKQESAAADILQQRGLNQRFQRLGEPNWYSGGSKTEPFSIIETPVVSGEEQHRSYDRIALLSSSFWSLCFGIFMRLTSDEEVTPQ